MKLDAVILPEFAVASVNVILRSGIADGEIQKKRIFAVRDPDMRITVPLSGFTETGTVPGEVTSSLTCAFLGGMTFSYAFRISAGESIRL